MSTVSTDLPEGSLLAAIDLGSNSFHLIIARTEHGEIRPIQTLSEKVQLGAGLTKSQLAQSAMDRGLACLTRFSQLLESIEPDRVRVVGTNALRQARNRRAFTSAAEEVLGIPVDVVYGREEARLIYLGVAHTLADDGQSRLVVDIGGGSTEFIIGQQFEPLVLESLQLGCVSYAEAFFPDGKISREQFNRAYDCAVSEVSHIRKRYQPDQWREAVGSSGTLRAIEILIQHQGWRDDGIDRASLHRLRDELLRFDNAMDIDLGGLNDKRRMVITAGVAITLAIFEQLEITVMRTSEGALREGVVYDLVGRLSHEDVRERSINAMVARYGADEKNAQIVGDHVAWLAQSVRDSWGFTQRDIDLLKWAGVCHEIGVAISTRQYHRHSAYLLENSDLPGFSQGEQEILSALVLGQRGRLRSGAFKRASIGQRTTLARMVALLRLAILLKYVETLASLHTFSVSAQEKFLQVTIPDQWQQTHPLTVWEINEAKPAMEQLGISLVLISSDGESVANHSQ